MFLHSFIINLVIVNCSAQLLSISNILPSGYNPKLPPNPSGVTTVNMSIIINNLIAVTESTSSFQLDFTLKLKWFENRLNISQGLTQEIQSPNDTIEEILLDSSFLSNFWIPDIYFQNGLSTNVVNSGLNIQFLAIGLNKSITYTVRLLGTFICKLDLTEYPQDYQYCSLETVSLTQTSDQLLLNWETFSSGNGELPMFRIRKSLVGDCVSNSYTNDFSCKSATIKLVRRVSYYVLTVYAPTFLCVIITFVSFWIPIVGWPARVAVVMTPLLTLITLDVSLNNAINVAYVVAIHWWMIWCQIYVYIALVEYGVAISWAHFVNEKKALKATEMGQKGIVIVKGHYFGNKNWYSKAGKAVDKVLYFFFGKVDYHKDPLMRNKVDYCSRLIFPFMWTVYILLYIFSTICPWAANYNL